MLAQDISPVNSVSYEWKSVPIWKGPIGGMLFPASGCPCWTG